MSTVELCHAASCTSPSPARRRHRPESGRKSIRQRSRIVGGNDIRAEFGAECLGVCADIGHDRCDTTSHGFEKTDGLALTPRREHEDIHGPICVDGALGPPSEAHKSIDAESARTRFEHAPLGSLTKEHEREPLIDLPAQDRCGIEQGVISLDCLEPAYAAQNDDVRFNVQRATELR